MPDNKETTTVVETDINLDTLLNPPGSDSVMIPGDKDDTKHNIFTRKQADLTFLDVKPDANSGKSKEELDAEAEAAKQEGIKNGTLNSDGTPKAPAHVSDEDLNNLGSDDDDSKKGAGRRKIDKDGLYEMTKKLIESKKLVPFDDDKPLEEYTLADYEELYEANDAEKEKKYKDEVPVQFFKSLPDKLKYAAKYVADGGQDLEGLFTALAESQRVANLDPETEGGADAIVRQYLQATKFGDSDEIQEEIDSWKDRGELEAKAAKFKPKLDALKEEYVQYKVQEQEHNRKLQAEQSQLYMKSVYEALEPGELNGIKLDKKVQSMIYTGLTQPSYPSINGKQTNLLGHLLEKYQWAEPRHDLIAEALWLLADPEGYKSKLREGGKKDAIADTVRKLKTEEGRKITSSMNDEDEKDPAKPKGIKRPQGSSFFKR